MITPAEILSNASSFAMPASPSLQLITSFWFPQCGGDRLCFERNSLFLTSIVLLSIVIGLIAWTWWKTRREQSVAETLLAHREVELRALARHLRSSQADRDRLLRDKNHTVKNNLQTIASLLSLQSRRIGRHAVDDAIMVLDKVQARLGAMALIQRRLYETETSAQVQIRPFISELVEEVVTNYRKTVCVKVELESWLIDARVAAPLGLILSELVSNAIEHGLANRGMTLTVSLTKLDAETSLLTVAHDGESVTSEFDLEEDSGLGLALASSLAEEIGGHLQVVQNGEHNSFQVSFSNRKLAPPTLM